MMKSILLLIVITFPNNSFSQDGNWAVYDTSNSSLPSNYINKIIIDSLGVKWIATLKGLVKISEQEWVVYDSNNTPLPADHITKIALDLDGGLWVGTISGLAYYDMESWSIYNKENSDLLENYISALAVDSFNRVWIGSYNSQTYIDGGLSIVNGNTWTNITKENSELPDNRILTIRIENEDVSWLGTVNGLVKLYDGNIYTYNSSNSKLPTNIIASIDIDENGNKWIAVKARFVIYDDVEDGGLVMMMDTSMTVYDDENSGITQRCNSINTVTVDKLDNIWFGMQTMLDHIFTYGSGLGVYNKENWSFYSNELPNSTIETIAFNKDNKIWIGTNGGIVTDETISNLDSRGGNEINSPNQISLFQNYPNPFNPITRIDYLIKISNFVSLKVYDLTGREIGTLVDEFQYSGTYSIIFNATELSSGIYLYKLKVGNNHKIKKMVLIQ